MHNGLENKARVAAVALEEQEKKVVEKSETARSARSQGATFSKDGHGGNMRLSSVGFRGYSMILDQTRYLGRLVMCKFTILG